MVVENDTLEDAERGQRGVCGEDLGMPIGDACKYIHSSTTCSACLLYSKLVLI